MTRVSGPLLGPHVVEEAGLRSLRRFLFILLAVESGVYSSPSAQLPLMHPVLNFTPVFVVPVRPQVVLS